MSDFSAAACLRREFVEATASTRIGGATVLQELSNLASSCIRGVSPVQDSVAFVLSVIFEQHAEDRYERPVTGDDTYLLMATGLEELTAAINFVECGGTAEQAVALIAALALLTPDRLYGRQPR
jgi:hypothetical protein